VYFFELQSVGNCMCYVQYSTVQYRVLEQKDVESAREPAAHLSDLCKPDRTDPTQDPSCRAFCEVRLPLWTLALCERISFKQTHARKACPLQAEAPCPPPPPGSFYFPLPLLPLYMQSEPFFYGHTGILLCTPLLAATHCKKELASSPSLRR
jgi:hypothetical protein